MAAAVAQADREEARRGQETLRIPLCCVCSYGRHRAAHQAAVCTRRNRKAALPRSLRLGKESHNTILFLHLNENRDC